MSKVKVLIPFAHSTIIPILISRNIIFSFLNIRNLDSFLVPFPSSQTPLGLPSDFNKTPTTSCQCSLLPPCSISYHSSTPSCSLHVFLHCEKIQMLCPTTFLRACMFSCTSVSAPHVCPVSSEVLRRHRIPCT